MSSFGLDRFRYGKDNARIKKESPPRRGHVGSVSPDSEKENLTGRLASNRMSLYGVQEWTSLHLASHAHIQAADICICNTIFPPNLTIEQLLVFQ